MREGVWLVIEVEGRGYAATWQHEEELGGATVIAPLTCADVEDC